jgi:hypothetical protein
VKHRGWLPRCRREAIRRSLGYAILLALALTSPARAALSDDVARLATLWSGRAHVERLRPRLLTRGERVPVPVPYRSSASPGCTNVAFLASPSISFAVLAPRGEHLEPRSSQVGWSQLTYCGARRAALERLSLEMRSPRGLIEVLVAWSSSPLPSPDRALAHRDPGPASPLGEPGSAPIPPPVEARGLAWEAQARRGGAVQVGRQVLRSDNGAPVMTRIDLAEGCHRLSALALQAAAGELPRDLDLFLRSETTPDLARQDQSENSDAEISVCVGESTPARVGVSGVGAAEPVVLQHASFRLPRGLPERWGPVLRGRFADAFFRRRFPGSSAQPIYETLGIAGRTLLPLDLEPRTCYAAGVSAIQGNLKGLLVEVAPLDGEGAVDSSSEDAALLLGFCTGDDGFVQLRIEATGSSVAWLSAIWRIQRQLFDEGPS